LISDKDTALVGRDYGKAFRKSLETEHGKLAELEKSTDMPIKFIIPRTIITMNKSFFLGAFADRIISIGKESFLQKYDFTSSAYINSKLEDYIEYALKTTSMADIIKG
jgi:hypothetical protein